MTLSIEKVLFSDDRDAHVFRARNAAGTVARYVWRKSAMRAPVQGECWEVESHVEDHALYGRQHVVISATLVRPRGDFLIQLLARHPALRGLGVGVVTARALFERHGVGLADMLSRSDVAALDELDPDVAAELCARWNDLDMEPAVVAWLTEYDFDVRIGAKLISLYGQQTIAAMEANPYCLLPFVPFVKIDAMACGRLHVAADDPRRLVAATEAVLYRALDDGHTASPRDTLRQQLLLLVGQNAERAIDVALEQEVAFVRHGLIQAYAPALMESTLEQWVQEAPSRVGQEAFVLLGKDDSIEGLVSRLAREEGLQLTPEQRAAILGALRSPLYCILGGAGVGKTTVLRILGRAIVELHGRAYFLAISGRAVRRIAESLGNELAQKCTVKTVAGFVHATNTPSEGDSPVWLIVDESSMLDLQSAYRLVTRIPGAAVVLVGDPHQLPPVGAGLFFHRIAEFNAVGKTTLTRIFRQAEETGIPAIADQVRAGVAPAFRDFEASGYGVQLRAVTGQRALGEVLTVRDALAREGEVQVLTLFKGTLGAAAINKEMHARVASGTPRLVRPLEVALGEPVIYMKNDSSLGLQNGSVGRVTNIHEDGLEIVWDDGSVRALNGAALLHCDLAHAITSHKSQGSQYERVVIFVPRASRVLDRTLIYTAITRATKQAVLVGDPEAICAAIRALPSATRRCVPFLQTSAN